MTHFTPIKVVSYLLYTSIIVHAVYALILTTKNKAARPVAYDQYNGKAGSAWSSRNMGILGTILLVFIVTHMQNFWYPYKFGSTPYVEYRTELATGNQEITTLDEIPSDFNGYLQTESNGVETIKSKDLYRQVAETFKNPLLVLFYLIGMAALSFHLIHGFKSAFQTLGWNHRRYNSIIRWVGIWVFGVVIPILFASMPLYFYFVK